MKATNIKFDDSGNSYKKYKYKLAINLPGSNVFINPKTKKVILRTFECKNSVAS